MLSCFSHRMHSEHNNYYDALGMKVLVTVYSANAAMVWHGCSGHRMRCNTYDALGMLALVTA